MKKLDERDYYKILLQTNYFYYCEKVNRQYGWVETRFHEYLCRTVQEFVERKTGNAYDILVLSTPPQFGKSMTITETFPSWYLGNNPMHKVIEVSYSEDFAERFGRRNNDKIAEYGSLFGIGLAKTPNTATEFQLDNKAGGMLSRGVSSGVTGNGANLFIIDDPVKTQQEADSENARNHLWEEWNYSYRSRLAPGAKVIVIMTRWHEDDLAGRIIANEKNVEVVNIPCEAEENDPLGRKPGEALCPEIGKGQKWLESLKESMITTSGSRAWNALYQGHPTAMKGNMIRREWWRWYDELPEIVDWVMSVDAAFKDGDDNDYVAIQIWGKKDADIYMIDAVKKHLDEPSTEREIIRLRSMYPKCTRTLIEDKANGSAIIQRLRKTMYGIIPVDPKGGKIARVNAILGAIESGNVHLPHKPFAEDFVNECSQFPRGLHDDQVDSMSQALNVMIYQDSKAKVTRPKSSIELNFPIFGKKKDTASAAGRMEPINVV